MKTILLRSSIIGLVVLGLIAARTTSTTSSCMTTPRGVSGHIASAALADEDYGRCAKLAAECASGHTCEDFCDVPAAEIEPTLKANIGGSGRRVTVSSLVSRALQDQAQLLLARKADLERWSAADQAHFATWFGTTSEAARETIYRRIRLLMLINREYAVGNFRFARNAQRGVFAFVHPNDPAKIFVAAKFVYAPFVGENSRAGTICHEMSHFLIAGGTRDFAYQPVPCKQLARSSPNAALYNADNFEFWVEGVR